MSVEYISLQFNIPFYYVEPLAHEWPFRTVNAPGEWTIFLPFLPTMHTPFYPVTDHLAIMPHPRGGAQLRGELQHLRQEGYEVLVSLLDASELKLLLLEDEERLCSEAGIELISFPVKDFGVPASDEKAGMLAEQLHEYIANGRKVMIHCRGGIGRSSLIAGAVLVRGGMSAEEAIAVISSCRGCKVPETGEQAAWLKGSSATFDRLKPS
jgi:protein-tyrosine phosphatase